METNRHIVAGTQRCDWLVADATALANREVRPTGSADAVGLPTIRVAPVAALFAITRRGRRRQRDVRRAPSLPHYE